MPLPIEHLLGFGIPPRVIAVWRAHGVENLLPLQEKALAEHGFLHGKSLLVLASTSSGKTLIAEMAALKHLEQNRRVVYLVPTKSLAEEKYRLFREWYGPLGYRIAVATRERPETDPLVLQGRFDLLIAVYEKMKAYLVAQPEMLSRVALVVADEIQMLGEPDRGATMDLLLTKIRSAPYPTQFIGLSAVLGDDAARLAAWLDCELLVYRKRPLDLREGAFDASTGLFHYRSLNSGEAGEERLREAPAEGGWADGDAAEDGPGEDGHFQREAILALASDFALGRGEQALVFVPTKRMCRDWAFELARRMARDSRNAPARQELARPELAEELLAHHEDTHARELLHQVVQQGVAFHNADLSWDLRECIERGFASGAIRVLFATSTLSQGVNLAGRNVLQVPDMVQAGDWTGQTVTKPLARSRFRNQGGRSARYQIAACPSAQAASGQPQAADSSPGFGRSILVARNGAEASRLVRDYVEGEIESLPARLDPGQLAAPILDLVVSKAAWSPGEIQEFFRNTFAGRVFWPAESAEIRRGIDEAIAALCSQQMLRPLLQHLVQQPLEAREGSLAATGIGEAAASAGLEPRTASALAGWLREAGSAKGIEPVEALLVLASTPEGRAANGIALGSEAAAAGRLAALIRRLCGEEESEQASEPLSPALQDILRPPGGMTRQGHLDIKKALLLEAWIGPADTREIEEHFTIFSGAIQNLAEQFAWLAQGAAALARALTLPTASSLEILGQRLALGCGPEGLGLRALRVPAFSRGARQALAREGYDSPGAIASADAVALGRLLPPTLARDLVKAARRLVREADDASRMPFGARGPAGKDSGNKALVPPATQPAAQEAAPTPSSPEPKGDAGSGEPAPGEHERNPAPLVAADGIFLEIDLRGTGQARLNGRAVRLTPLPFQLLVLLARRLDLGANRNEIALHLWDHVPSEGQQIDAHHLKIIRAFAEIVPHPLAKKILPTLHRKGLRLDLKPGQVRIIEKEESGAPEEQSA